MEKKSKNKLILLLIGIYVSSLSGFYFIYNYKKFMEHILPRVDELIETIKEPKTIDIIPIDPLIEIPTTTPVQDDSQNIPSNHNYTNQSFNEAQILPANSTLMEAVKLGSPFYSQGIELLISENINQCFKYRYSDGVNLGINYKQGLNSGMMNLCNRYYQMMNGVETVIRTESERASINPDVELNPDEIICGWFNGGFSNVVNIVNHSVCLSSKTLYHEVAHLLNYRWAYLKCDDCLIGNYAIFNHDKVKTWTQNIVDNVAFQYKTELGEMTEENQQIFNQAYNPTEYASTSILERFAEMFARDMSNIETGKKKNRFDVILFDSLGWG